MCVRGPGERIVGPASTLFLDEISTGLDSSTTYLIVRCIRNFCHMQQVFQIYNKSIVNTASTSIVGLVKM
jgi:ABC-type multidrug transport system ATPase subunit